jgi:single-stranded-DNA-specific exonuclease
MMEIKNLKKAAERILKAIKEKENIVLYGDADLDGVSSVMILKETIKNLGGEISAVYFPNREKEGYGISEIGLNYLKKFSPALFISMDLGITNFKEVKLARKLGFEVVLIDHHEVIERLPEADIIVNPKQEGDEYEFKELAATGIIFKLSELLLQKKMSEILRRNFIELAALATIADMMPQEKDNKLFIKEGKARIENSWRPGIRAFFKFEEIERLENLEQKLAKIISILNIREVRNNFPASYKLLTLSSEKEAEELIGELFVQHKLRKDEINKMTEAIERDISGKEPIIFIGSSDFEFTLIPTAASIICKKYELPTFIYKRLEKEAVGTVRTPSKINGISLMKKCANELLTFGGHPSAAGFRIKNENLEKFKECLIEQFRR